jgi:isocitrate dehydrogenase
MMLEYLGWKEAGEMIKKALEKTIQKKKVTYDLARQIKGAKTIKASEFAKEIVKNM